MIGVFAPSEDQEVVAEFFQLFKTPWEFFRDGQSYDAVIVTADEVPEVDAKLVLIYGPELKRRDPAVEFAACSSRRNVILDYQGSRLPLYGTAMIFEKAESGTPCVTGDAGVVGLRVRSVDCSVLRLGYDLFREVACLLSTGQPPEYAHIPTLEMHIMMLRDWILEAGITLLEIPPSPSGHPFAVCLTHDIDFVRIRDHKFDHTMWGFLYRSTVGAICSFLRGRIPWRRLLRSWRAALSLPLVHLGLAKDFWLPFDWYLRVEEHLPSTYFLIPFKQHAGDRAVGKHAKRRAASYDITEIPEWTATLMREGRELAVHGIDAWHSVDKGREELRRIAAVTGGSETGVRMHWLWTDENTFRVLEKAGYAYDSTAGYNETVGYRSGTTQAYRPLGTRRLLELPLHIQDGALFYRQRLALSEPEAWKRCVALIVNAKTFAGVLTILWHDRSHGPERFWGDFYVRILAELKSLEPWFATAGQVTSWFRQRREVVFECLRSAHAPDHLQIRSPGNRIDPPVILRVHCPTGQAAARRPTTNPPRWMIDVPWAGQSEVDIGRLLRRATNEAAQAYLAISSPS